MASITKRRGRPSKPYRCADGTEVHGLYRLPDGRWRITATGVRFTEPDERLAVRKFRHWQSRNAPESELPVTLRVTVQGNKEAGDIAEFLNSLPPDTPDLFNDHVGIDGATGQVTVELPVDPDILWPWLRYQLLHAPEWLAKMTGVAELAGLRHLPLDRDPLALSVLWTRYASETGSKKDTINATRRVWERLLAFTSAKTLDDLTTEKLNAFRADIEASVAGAGTRKLYYSKIRTVIAFGLKCGLDAVQIGNTLNRCKVLWTKARLPPKNPTPISRGDFHALLAFAASEKKWEPWRAWLLLGLNLCLHIGEACELRWNSFDLKKRTFATFRSKEERHRVPRAAMLWPETLAALRALKASASQSPYVFTSRHGTFYNRNKRVNSFAEFRNAAGMPHVTFDHIRDGAYTAAITGAPDERWARVLAGHGATGFQDNYVLRNAQMTDPACKAVYAAYFGGTTNSHRSRK